MSPDLDRIALRVRNEFREMPGLQISFSQMTRLCGLEPAVCRAVVEVLVGSAFLRWTARDLLARVDGHTGRTRRAPAASRRLLAS